jgi:transcriptional regulator with XRE-family HTH domain
MTTPDSPRDPALIAFGSAARTAREKAGRRLVDFAAEIEISEYHLRSIETGRDRASNIVYWKIADALELDPTPVLRKAAS